MRKKDSKRKEEWLDLGELSKRTVLSERECAYYVGKSVHAIGNLRQRKKIPFFRARDHRSYLCVREEIDAWMLESSERLTLDEWCKMQAR